MTFHADRYVPFLKGKQGEFSALRELRAVCSSLLTPLIDVPRVPIKNRTSPLEDHLGKQAERIASAWSSGAQIFVDLTDLPLDARGSAGQHPVTLLSGALSELGVDATPVTGTDRDDAYQEAIRELTKESTQVAIRLLPEDLDTPSTLQEDVDDLLAAVEVEPESVHILMDLRSLKQREDATWVSICVNAIAALPAVDRYASLTVVGSSMPQTLGELVKTSTTGTVRRRELDVWSQLQRVKGLVRRPSFGDYGVVHPDLMDLDPRQITVAADIRYTIPSEMLIVRGSSTRHHPLGFGQYHALAKSLVAMPEYSGRTFSWGDETIYRKAHAISVAGPGNKTTWVQIATNHHLEFVVKELPSVLSGLATRAAS